MKKSLILVPTVLSAVCVAQGAGFALYEPSSAATSLGGALVGKAYDASANSVNPATLTDVTRPTLQLGFVTEHPRAREKFTVNGATVGASRTMDPGFFVLPHFQFAMPIGEDFAIGLGAAPEYGLGTHYTHNSEMNWSSRETTIQGYVVNPNVAYRITDRWSVGAGLRLMYFSFEQYRDPAAGMEAHLRGNNSFRDFAGRFGTSYRLRDDFAVGATYQMRMNTRVKGRSNVAAGGFPLPGHCGAAKASLALPQAVSVGYNWDIAPEWHLGQVLSWTDWSEIDSINFRLPQGSSPTRLGWRDTWRLGTGLAWDFVKDWTAMTSYVFDTNPCPSDQESTMLPPGDRHILTWGLAWRVTENLELGLNYGIVLMQRSSMHMTRPGTALMYGMETHRGLSHAAGGTVTYRF